MNLTNMIKAKIREAMRTHFLRRFPEVPATRAELRALERGREAMRRGDYVTYEQLIGALDAPDRKSLRRNECREEVRNESTPMSG